jgi:hypothetical protein
MTRSATRRFAGLLTQFVTRAFMADFPSLRSETVSHNKAALIACTVHEAGNRTWRV